MLRFVVEDPSGARHHRTGRNDNALRHTGSHFSAIERPHTGWHSGSFDSGRRLDRALVFRCVHGPVRISAKGTPEEFVAVDHERL
jgi:hypothetical protein